MVGLKNPTGERTAAFWSKTFYSERKVYFHLVFFKYYLFILKLLIKA